MHAYNLTWMLWLLGFGVHIYDSMSILVNLIVCVCVHVYDVYVVSYWSCVCVHVVINYLYMHLYISCMFVYTGLH